MPELRQNFFTKEWVIIATERAQRPEDLVVQHPPKRLRPSCKPVPSVQGKKVRPPRDPAIARDLEPTRTIHRSHRTINGFGVHDVIIETPDHSQYMALMSDAHLADILRIYKTRYNDLSLDPRIAQIAIFKNHGRDTGTSFEHPNSQLVATPVISHQVRERLQQALNHYDEYGDCMFCQMIQEELEEQARVVMVTPHFAAVELFASASPFSTYIYPLRHMASFGDISGTEINDLARVLRTVLAKLYAGLKNPDFNYTIGIAPSECFGAKYFHWYVSIIPRMTRVAGFELGPGMFINTVLPETAAELLHQVKVDHADAAVV
jgi:UDPglucose--hexose-1-phosphate uridylyltransferase